jgi:hypothetical protein
MSNGFSRGFIGLQKSLPCRAQYLHSKFMSLLDRLENSLGRFAIPGLIRYVVALNALVFLLTLLQPAYVAALVFSREAIEAGQVWRLVTWIFIPTTQSLLLIFAYLSFTWWVGDGLEAAWGTFRLNVYYFLGLLGCVASGFIFGVAGGNAMLTLTLLLAAATLEPNLQILLFYLIPMRLKWVAVIGLIYPAYIVATGGLPGAALVALCLINYLVFFGPTLLGQARANRAAGQRRARFEAAKLPAALTLHRCESCARTEVSNPDLEFRVASDGHEYCADHLPSRQTQER